MYTNIYVYAVEVSKWGEDNPFKVFHLIAQTMLEAGHIAADYVYDPDNKFSQFPSEITKISKVEGIDTVINGSEYFVDDEEHNEYNPDIPQELAKNLPDDEIMKFKCSCGEEIRTVNGMWPYTICHECHNNIRRGEIENVGGIFIYSKLDSNKR